MTISLKPGPYIGTCIVAGALNAYSNPRLWITAFAVGILAGSMMGARIMKEALSAQQRIDATTASMTPTEKNDAYFKNSGSPKQVVLPSTCCSGK